jgi:hypothetical protein
VATPEKLVGHVDGRMGRTSGKAGSIHADVTQASHRGVTLDASH